MIDREDARIIGAIALAAVLLLAGSTSLALVLGLAVRLFTVAAGT